MPCTRRTPKEREENEARIQAALSSLRSGLYKTPGEAARVCGVNPVTLRDRWMNRHRDNTIAHLDQQLLTDMQGEALVSWCIHLSLLAQPLDRHTIGSYVHALCGKYPSPSWVQRFLRKHRDLLTLRSTTGIDPKRARSFNKPTVDRHFNLFKSVMQEHAIPPENLYNMDEKGIQLGGGRKGNGRKFICGRVQRTSLKLRDPNLELVTVVECISANGQGIPPGFILTGVPGNYHEQWYERKGVGSIALSPNGWTDDELTYLWFVKVFVPFAQARNVSGKPIMLMMDGHGSHSTDKMREYGYSCEPRVHIYLLPPHTTHRLQPLDSSVFGVGQRRWSKLCDTRTMEGQLITRDTVVTEWMDLRHTFMREDIISSSWQKTGLFPLNPGVFREEDFAPSHAFSVRSHLPNGYPATPSADIDESDSGEETEVIETTTGGSLQPEVDMIHETHPISKSSESPTNPVTLRDILPPPGARLQTKPQLNAEIARLRNYLTSSIAQNEAAVAHASLMAQQNEELQKRMNTKKRGGRKKLTTDARLVTSDEYVAMRRKEVEEEEAEAKRLAEKVERRDRERDKRQRDRVETAHNVVWSAGWRHKKKDDLKDLCYVLSISMEGTRDDMIRRVETHLAGHPFLVNETRFRGMFAARE